MFNILGTVGVEIKVSVIGPLTLVYLLMWSFVKPQDICGVIELL